MLLTDNEITLRIFEKKDINNKINWINDEKNNQFLHYDIPITYEKTLLWFDSKNNDNRCDLVIEYQGIEVGLIGLIAIDKINGKAEFYISMGEQRFKRKGIATHATKMLLEYAFDALCLNKVYLNVDAENEAACRLYEKVGFKCEGVFLKDILHRGRLVDRKRYSMLKEDFCKSRGVQMNILILSVGTRNKIVQYFKNAIGGSGNVIVTDCSLMAPAIYEADRYYQVPKVTDKGYLEKVLEICEKEKIQAVLSLIDTELSLLAKEKQRFEAVGTMVVGSSYELCELCLNKWEMYKWLVAHNYKCAKSYISKEEFFEAVEKGEINYPVFIKPICGSASIAISKVYDRQTVELLFTHSDGLMIQEYLNGQEIGADCYIDMISKELVSVFTKKKLIMRAGETDKAVSFKDEKLFRLIESFVSTAGFKGQIDIDIFEINGEYYISEVNPRFGGGYPHAYECGCDHTKLIINNLNGTKNSKNIGAYEDGIYMMKYNEIKTTKI